MPLLVRILYGRFISKSRGSKAAREQNLSRRAAILSFLSRLLPKEMVHLVHLMLRGVVPPHRLLQLAQATTAHTTGLSSTYRTQQQVPTTITERTTAWYAEVQQCAVELSVSDVQELSWERQVGFLHLFEQTIKLIGFGATSHVGVCVHTSSIHSLSIRILSIHILSTCLLNTHPLDLHPDTKQILFI